MFKIEILSLLPNITLSNKIDQATQEELLQQFMQILDQVAQKYTIQKQTTDLISIEDGEPAILKYYLVAKSIEGLSPTTLSFYRITLKNFFAKVNKSYTDITTNDIRIYLFQYKEERKVQNCTLDTIRVVITSFYDWCLTEGLPIQTNPARAVNPIKQEEKPRESLTPIELEYIRDACKTLREKALIDFLYSTACRVSEVVNAKISNINWQDHSILIEHGKGNKTRKTYINAECEVSLRAYLNSRTDGTDYLFVTSRKPLNPLGKKSIEVEINNICARVQDKLHCHVHPHLLRHTSATIALHNGMPIEQVRQFLGHSNIKNTLIYAKSNDTEVRLSHEKYV